MKEVLEVGVAMTRGVVEAKNHASLKGEEQPRENELVVDPGGCGRSRDISQVVGSYRGIQYSVIHTRIHNCYVYIVRPNNKCNNYSSSK